MSMKTEFPISYVDGYADDLIPTNALDQPNIIRGDFASNKQGSAEMNADKTIVVDAAPASSKVVTVSNNSTVQNNTVATFRGDQ